MGDILKEVAQGSEFRLADGQVVNSLVQLAGMLSDMSADIFYHHVTPDKNDFAAWVNDVYAAKTLAKQIGALKNQSDMAEVLQRALTKKKPVVKPKSKPKSSSSLASKFGKLKLPKLKEPEVSELPELDDADLPPLPHPGQMDPNLESLRKPTSLDSVSDELDKMASAPDSKSDDFSFPDKIPDLDVDSFSDEDKPKKKFVLFGTGKGKTQKDMSKNNFDLPDLPKLPDLPGMPPEGMSVSDVLKKSKKDLKAEAKQRKTVEKEARKAEKQRLKEEKRLAKEAKKRAKKFPDAMDLPDLDNHPLVKEMEAPSSEDDTNEVSEEELKRILIPPTQPKKKKFSLFGKKSKQTAMELPPAITEPIEKSSSDDNILDVPDMPNLPDSSSFTDLPDLPELPDSKSEQSLSESLPEPEKPVGHEMYGSLRSEMEQIDNMKRVADHEIRERQSLIKVQEEELKSLELKLQQKEVLLDKKEADLAKGIVQDTRPYGLGLEKQGDRIAQLDLEISALRNKKSHLQIEVMHARDQLKQMHHEFDAKNKILDNNKKLLDMEEDRIISRVEALEKDKKLLAGREDEFVKTLKKLEREKASLEKAHITLDAKISKKKELLDSFESKYKSKLAILKQREKDIVKIEKEVKKKLEKISKVKELKESIADLKKKKANLEGPVKELEKKLSTIEKKYLSGKTIKAKEEELTARERELFARKEHVKEDESRLRYEEENIEDKEFKQFLAENVQNPFSPEEHEDPYAADVNNIETLLANARDALERQNFEDAKVLFRELKNAYESSSIPAERKKELYYKILEIKTDIDLALLREG